MKQYALHYIYAALFLVVATAATPSACMARGIRIIPRSIQVLRDSLHLHLLMDLNQVSVGSSLAITFTPVLSHTKQQLDLSAVVISGTRRERTDRRERFLEHNTDETAFYTRLHNNRRTDSRTVDYRISVPFASWMQHASLLLRQESKDCCEHYLLGTDTLKKDLALAIRSAGASVAQTAVAAPTTGKATIRPEQPAIPRKTTTVTTAANVTPTTPARVVAAEPAFADMVSWLTPIAANNGKNRNRAATLYPDYPLGKDDIYPDYKNNRHELDKIGKLVTPLLDSDFSEIDEIRICGYASPDGNYRDNETLSATRAARFSEYVRITYGLPRSLFSVSSVAEDWEGLIDLLQQTSPPYREAALDIIRRYGIFNGRERELMNLQGGIPYKTMLRELFPRLRRIEVTVSYRVRAVSSDEAADLLYTHADLLSLEEIYEVARYYRPGTDQYREIYEIAAYHFPDDVVANINAASAVMLTGDLISAWEYLRKAEADPRAWNNIGVLTLMEGNPEGAAVWFRKAVGLEPRKARANLEIALERSEQP